MGLPDVLGLIVTLTSVAIAALAVFIGFLLSQNYSKYIRELESVRLDAQKNAELIKSMNDFNSSQLRESMLAVRTIFDLLMLMDRQHDYSSLLRDVAETQSWKGKKKTILEIQTYKNRIMDEIAKVSSSINARRTELYWLVGQQTEKAAHLHALTSAHGDHRTLELLEAIKTARQIVTEKEELLVATSALRQRLGLPIKISRIEYDSRKWTGRYKQS